MTGPLRWAKPEMSSTETPMPSICAFSCAALPPVRRRLTWRNPVNGQRSLYIASHAGAIEGMAKADAMALLQELTEGATAEPWVYRHAWRPGDVVLWDNRATMHRGRPFPVQERRAMVRTTISATSVDGLDEVRL